MSSRMEKYDVVKEEDTSRISKNRKLYDDVFSLNVDYIDVDNALEIPLKTNYNNRTRSNYHKLKELDGLVPLKKQDSVFEEPIVEDRERIYDIDEFLKKRKEEKDLELKKRDINTEYNILTKLDLKDIENKEFSKDDLKEIVNKIYPKIEKDTDKDLLYEMTEKISLVNNNNNKDNVSSGEFKEEQEEKIPEEKEDKEKDEAEDLSKLSKEELIERTKEIVQNLDFEDPILDEDKNLKSFTEKIETCQKKGNIFLIIIVFLLVLAGIYLTLKYFGTI